MEKTKMGTLFDAVRRGDLTEVERLLNEGADLNARDERDGRDDTPLHWACIFGRPHIVRLLLDRGADVGARDEYDRTPLHYAGIYSHPDTDVVRLLLDRGADIEARDIDSYTPLHKACEWGTYNTVRLLLDRGADLEARDQFGNTPLDFACDLPESDPTREPLLEIFQELAPEAWFTKFCESPGRMPGRGL